MLELPAPRLADLRLSSGLRLHLAERGPQGAPPLILLHGFTDDHHSFDLIAAELAISHRVITPDQRGHGASDQPLTAASLADLSRDLIELMDALQLPSAALLGHSMGSAVALHAAAAAPERITRLALLGAAADWDRPELRVFQAQLADLPDPVPPEFIREFQVSTTYAPVPKDFFEVSVLPASARLPARLWRQLLAGLLDTPLAPHLPHVRAPARIYWGEHDTYAPRQQQQRLLDLLPRATLHTYPDTGHAPHWERPQQLTADLLTHLRAPA